MQQNLSLIIFDWGGTLYESSRGRLAPGTFRVLKHCQRKGYDLALVSLARSEGVKERFQAIQRAGIDQFFSKIKIVTDCKGKDQAYQLVLKELGHNYANTAIVDDRVIRGIRWGNWNGCTTIWIRQGRYAYETPNDRTRQPTHIASTLLEVLKYV